MANCLGCGQAKHAGLCHTKTPKASKPRVDTPSLAAIQTQKEETFADLVTCSDSVTESVTSGRGGRRPNAGRKRVLPDRTLTNAERQARFRERKKGVESAR